MNNPVKLIKDVISKFHTSYGIYVDDDSVYIIRLMAGFKEPQVNRKLSGPLSKEKPLAKYLLEIFPHAKPFEERIEFKNIFSGHKHKKELKLLEKLYRFLAELPETMTVGIKDTTVFYYAFAVSQKQKTIDIDLIVNENQKAEFLHSKKLIYDWRNFQNEDQNFILISAAKRPTIMKIWKDFDDIGLVPSRFEPGPVAALRAAWNKVPPSSALPEIRILIGPEMTLVSLNKNRVPLSWNLLNTVQENFAEAIFPATQNLVIYTRKQFTADGVSKIVVQGSNPDRNLAARLTEMTGIPCETHEFAPYDGYLVAYGLALGTLYPEMQNINLVREIQKRVSLLTTFPYLETFITTGLILLTAIYLGMQTERLDKNVRLRTAMNAQVSWAASQSNDAINKSIKTMRAEMGPLTAFYAKRTSWSDILTELAEIIPPSIQIKSLYGRDVLWAGKRGGARTFILQFECVSGADGARPETQVEKFLDALKQSKHLVKWFPKVQLKAVSMKPDGSKIFATVTLE
ncbi:MAG: hypothetical protein PHW69_05625 [Elusimicrobiaceae bacterium]|nr:hypothetical protein [Elusimicrobiaceae bacterium]